MKFNQFYLLAALLCFTIAATAQNSNLPLILKTGKVVPAANISDLQINNFNNKQARFKNKSFGVLQFETIPSEAAKKELADNGIVLLDYVPQNAYTVSITGKPNAGLLQRAKARALVALTPQQKMHPALAAGQIPAWAVKVGGTVDVWVTFSKAFSAAEVMQALKENNMDVLPSELIHYRIIALRIAINRLTQLADLPFITYVQPALPKDQPLNFNNRWASGAIGLNAAVADGGNGLNGEGIVIGVGDNADVQYHIDFNGRLINRSAAGVATHGTHVTGIAAGGGIINEQLRGYASKATIVSQAYSGILANAGTYIQDYGMVVTNNSYGNVVDCYYNGTYDIYSYILDQQAFDYPELQHVFAAGNSGANSCTPYPAGYGTVLGSYQSAKNVITVGNTDYLGNLFYASSRGPVKDGRTKPDLTAMGAAVLSTVPTNSYNYDWGTSMASPAVAGGLTLLYQRYRQLHSGSNPKSALMKALICNGAADKGNSGPDYNYGFGFMNLTRSEDMLEHNHYYSNNISNAATQQQTITVPANTAQVKIMLYWHDPAGAMISGQTLVNDLDLQVTDPSAATLLPKILNGDPAYVSAPATNGADHVNNMEQVVIDNPVAGTYTISVNASRIVANPSQDYVVVYDVVPVSTQLTYPVGGCALVPGEQINIGWTSYGDPANTFTLQYSTDNGGNWTDIATAVDASARYFNWTVPNVSTANALVRIQRNGTAIAYTSQPFTIIGTPNVTLSAAQCEGYISIDWPAVANATDYEVMILRGNEMVPAATTFSNTYAFNSLSKDSTYWVSVRARINGKPGRRALAISRQPIAINCSGTQSDNDLKLNAILAPASGRKFTSTALGNVNVKVEIKNLDDAPATAFNVAYQVNNGAWVSENVAVSIAAGGTYTHTFATTENFSATGNYTLTAVVKNAAADMATTNDTLQTNIKNLDNQPIDLTISFLDNLETASSAEYKKDTIGLTGISRYDFKKLSPYGRVRTFVNSGMAYSGSKAITLDKDRYSTDNASNYFDGTFNLSNYTTTTNDLRLDFLFNNHSQNAGNNNKVYIRGDDTQPWLLVYDMYANRTLAGIYKRTPSIDLSDSLAKNGQQFTPSFQVRWEQNGNNQATDLYSGAGITIDDIHLYEVFNDMQLLSIDAPLNLNCNLSNNAPVTITISNSSSNTITSIPVRYQVNNGAWVSEIVASLAGNTTLQYTFTTKADFSTPGKYLLKTIVDLPLDSYHANDTATQYIFNASLVSTFPSIENFEGSNGGWYSDGVNTSWEYGTPSSTKINRAASGAKAWKTRLAGNYNDLEQSYLYSPCYDITGMTNPTLSLSMALDLEDCGSTFCDGAWVEYSTDNKTWTRLTDTASAGTNWYNTTKPVWSIQNYTTWHVATMPLPTTSNIIRLRIVMHSDEAVNREGIAIDDINIYDNKKGIYNGSSLTAPVTQTINSNNWVDFESGGKLIASVNAGSQNLGTTDAQAYINTGAVRYTSNQYYHNRNITIKPAVTAPTDSVAVRFYFLESETNALLAATGCNTCSKPSSAYELGVSKYTDVNKAYENETIGDDNGGVWTFIKPADVTIVPFDKGYYAEFKVKDFSEFWLNNGSFNKATPLPLKLVDFTAQKQSNNTVLVKWTTASEINVSRFEVELAEGNTDLQNNHFTTIGSVNAKGTSSSQQDYTFTDKDVVKSDAYYYRLKMIDKDGSFRYSETRAVLFSDAITWQVFPNPSTGVFHFVYQAAKGEKLSARLTDLTGRALQQFNTLSDGFVQKLVVDLSGKASGAYLLQVTSNGKTKNYKLYKQ